MKFNKWGLIVFSLILLGFMSTVLAAFPTDVSVYLNTTDNLNTSTSNYNFTYTILWNGSYFINNCTLMGNFTGSWLVNETNGTAVVNGTGTLNGINTPLSDGTYIWNVKCYYNDTNSDTADANRTITIDTAQPTGSITTPSNNSWHNANFLINASVTGTPATVQYRYENSTTNGSWTSMTNPSGNYWNATFDISAVANGNYTIRINATDAVGNSNTTLNVFIWVDTTSPSITFSCSPTSVYIGETVTCSCSASDNLDTSVSLSYTTNPDTDSGNTHQTTCTATDDAGNSATSTVTYIVDYRSTGVYIPKTTTTRITTTTTPVTTTTRITTTTTPVTTIIPVTTIPITPLTIPAASYTVIAILVVVFLVLAFRLELFK